MTSKETHATGRLKEGGPFQKVCHDLPWSTLYLGVDLNGYCMSLTISGL